MSGYRRRDPRPITLASMVLLCAVAFPGSAVSAQDQPRESRATKPAGAAARPQTTRPATTPARDVQTILEEARDALRGKNKNLSKAHALLLELVEHRRKELADFDLCHVLVYLGYIEDLQGNRAAARDWFDEASEMKGRELQWIRQVAERGLEQPVTFIRHLDEVTEAPPADDWKTGIIEKHDGVAISEKQPPSDLKPDADLAREQFNRNFESLCDAIDRHYAFFEYKHIDWPAVVARYRPKVAAATTPEEFYATLQQLVAELQDAHSWLCNFRERRAARAWTPGLEIRQIEKQAVVVGVTDDSAAAHAGVQRGSIITEVDGQSVAERIATLRADAGSFSSERARVEELYRRLLDGPQGSTVKVTCRAAASAAPATLELKRDSVPADEPAPPDFPITRGKFVWSGVHPSGYGYIRILSFDGREEIADEFDRALDALKDAPGLVLDIRDNLGGFGTAQPRIVGRFITQRTKTGAQVLKNGRAHDSFSEHPSYFGPAGPWQYTRPLALLLNARTGSASDLFAAYLISTGRPLTVGTTTHGNLSGTGVYIVLPCNLVVRISNGYICDAHGRIIEEQGNEPALRVEPTLADVAAGRDTGLERAVAALREQGAHPTE